ncbi:MAG: putative quinol monooxygenase, partial [Methanoregulaceae archaeon]
TIDPERESEFTREVRKIIPVVRGEAGCIRYEFFSDAFLPGIFHFIEVWESQEHLDDHLARHHMQEYFKKTAVCHSSPAELALYEVFSSRSMTMNG